MFLFPNVLFSSPRLTYGDVILDREDIEKYPDGGSLHYILEYRNLSTVVSNFESNGFSETEDLIVSNHMTSIYWQKYYLDGISLRDAARPGISSIKIPISFLKSIRIKNDMALTSGLWGIHYQLVEPVQNFTNGKSNSNFVNQYSTTLNTAFPILGPSWMPSGTFDREPAQEWGADSKTRKFLPSGDLSGYSFVNDSQGNTIFTAAEILYHQRRFIQMDQTDESYRVTSIVRYAFQKNGNLTFIYQNQKSDHTGMEFFLDEKNTKKTTTHAIFVSGDAKWKAWDKTFKIESGINSKYREEDFYSSSVGRTLEEEINQYSPINPAFNGISSSWETSFSIYHNQSPYFLHPDYYNLNLILDYIHKKEDFPNNQTSLWYGENAAFLTVYENAKWQENTIFHFSPTIHWEKNHEKLETNTYVGVLLEAAPKIYRIDSAFSMDARHKTFDKVHFLFGIAHDPIPITSREVDFLDGNYLSGTTYFWDDINGNGIAEDSEYNQIYSSTGSKYHTKSNDLRMPTSEKIRLGLEVPMKNSMYYQFMITGSYYRNLLTVEMDESSGVVYQEVPSTLVSGGILYNRIDSNQGEEKYILTNSNEPAFMVAFETQLIKDNESNSPWFYEFSIGAYYSEVTTPMGTGPFYNDIGYYSESTADPNKTLMNWARPDYDRAYILQLMAGRSFARYWKLSGILRYRDGEPIGYYQIVDGLNQGPTIVQSWYRSKPDLGRPRLTYALNLDVRLSYIRKKYEKKLAFYLDIYNILNSKTEIREYLIENDYRRDPLETNMERSLRIRVEYGF